MFFAAAAVSVALMTAGPEFMPGLLVPVLVVPAPTVTPKRTTAPLPTSIGIPPDDHPTLAVGA